MAQAVKSCTVFAVQADGAEITDDRGHWPRTASTAPGPEGLLGDARPAVRLLHPRHDHDRDRASSSATRTRPKPRSATRWKATSAAAPATRTSSRRSSTRRAARRRRHEAGPARPRLRARGRHRARPEISGLGRSARRQERSDGHRRRRDMAATVEAPEKLVGKPIKRREDPRLITGAGNFLDDIRLPGMAYAAILRSPHAHAKIREHRHQPRRSACRASIGVFTGDDFMDVNPLPCAWQAAGVENNVDTPRVLALGEVRQVGDPVAVVVAESVYQADDAARGDRGRLRGAAGGRRRARRRSSRARRSSTRTRRTTSSCDWTCGKDAATVDARAGRGRGAGQPAVCSTSG